MRLFCYNIVSVITAETEVWYQLHSPGVYIPIVTINDNNDDDNNDDNDTDDD